MSEKKGKLVLVDGIWMEKRVPQNIALTLTVVTWR